MKKSNEQGIGDAIKQLFKVYRLDEKVAEVQIKEIWGKIMGVSIKNYTTKMHLNKGVLTIYIESAPLKQDLKFSKDTIIQRINEELKEKVVREVIIK
jgi:predicted nucleic acid-binding Zn ribbon protein